MYILDGDKSIKELERDTVMLKKEIRDRYSFTHSKDGYLLVDDVVTHLNLVHSPNGDISLYDRDLEKFMSFSGKREVSEEEFSRILKYRSFNI